MAFRSEPEIGLREGTLLEEGEKEDVERESYTFIFLLGCLSAFWKSLLDNPPRTIIRKPTKNTDTSLPATKHGSSAIHGSCLVTVSLRPAKDIIGFGRQTVLGSWSCSFTCRRALCEDAEKKGELDNHKTQSEGQRGGGTSDPLLWPPKPASGRGEGRAGARPSSGAEPKEEEVGAPARARRRLKGAPAARAGAAQPAPSPPDLRAPPGLAKPLLPGHSGCNTTTQRSFCEHPGVVATAPLPPTRQDGPRTGPHGQPAASAPQQRSREPEDPGTRGGGGGRAAAALRAWGRPHSADVLFGGWGVESLRLFRHGGNGNTWAAASLRAFWPRRAAGIRGDARARPVCVLAVSPVPKPEAWGLSNWENCAQLVNSFRSSETMSWILDLNVLEEWGL
ncbi:uncharacterized protein LOC110743104 [Papio anubis]|uniref:uncharacterized protein LOC110743104 n=1 Tax=Papio anubis TaxID=9555 RepID=UPI0012ADFEBC|nr:uncharacterized protein LOC110743104 [Papio anubis]